MTYDIPRRVPPEEMPPIKTQEDLCQLWRMLMGKLGFARRRIWFVTLDRDGAVLPGVVQIDECPVRPDRIMLVHLMDMILDLFEEDPRRHSVAFLWSRPGGTATTAADLCWAAAIRDAAKEAMLPTWPIHLANDFDLRVFAPDELAA